MTENINVVIKWSGREYPLEDVSLLMTVLQLKELIYKETNVRPERQKLLGLKLKGKPPKDDVKLSALTMKPGMKIMMMGTQEETLVDVIEPPKEITENNVVDDFDIEEEEVAIQHREEFLAKIQRRVDSYKIEEINPPREGKRLLVLDIDYTLFDHRSSAESGVELMRPYLHEFLTAVYPHYDIVIWSATGMKWIKAKMQELNVLNNGNYKLMFMLDNGAMITVHTEKYGVVETKPLAVIWGKYPQYSSKNTIMFDDLRRNFLMNPFSGLKIRPFKNAHVNRDTDKELLNLSKYLLKITQVEDFDTLNHSKWDKCNFWNGVVDTEHQISPIPEKGLEIRLVLNFTHPVERILNRMKELVVQQLFRLEGIFQLSSEDENEDNTHDENVIIAESGKEEEEIEEEQCFPNTISNKNLFKSKC